MSNLVSVRPSRRDVTQFEPAKTDMKLDALEAVVRRAQKMRDWESLLKAVGEMIAEQFEFVAWWDRALRSVGNPTKLNVPERGQLTTSQAEAETGITKQQVSRWRASLKDCEKYHAKLCGAAYRAARLEAEENHRAVGTGENEWYTPAEYIELARQVLGGIDLDPASSEVAQATIRAARFFTKEDDGLSRAWLGRVWLNPPYTQPEIAHFVSKLVEEYRLGRVQSAILLTHNYTDTGWFHEAATVCDAVCFTRGRIKFVDAEGEIAAPTQGQAFFYFGLDVPRFADAFRSVGVTLTTYQGEM